MLIGFISDAHGNPFGLSKCLERLYKEGAGKIYFLGDAVGYWPHGLAVIKELLRLKIPCIKGNHDAMVLGLLPIDNEKDNIYRLKNLIPSLPKKVCAGMNKNWPVRREITIDKRHILLVHGRPSNPLEGYFYEDSSSLPGEFLGFDVVIMGHTHRPFIKYKKNTLCINAGSCGLPRDVGNIASCALYDSISHSAKILRVEIDIQTLLTSCPSGSVAFQVIECLKRR